MLEGIHAGISHFFSSLPSSAPANYRNSRSSAGKSLKRRGEGGRGGGEGGGGRGTDVCLGSDVSGRYSPITTTTRQKPAPPLFGSFVLKGRDPSSPASLAQGTGRHHRHRHHTIITTTREASRPSSRESLPSQDYEETGP